jgi:hypothetical protein
MIVKETRDDEVDKEIKEFLEYYEGYDIPNPEHEPIRFAHWVRVFKYYRSALPTSADS